MTGPATRPPWEKEFPMGLPKHILTIRYIEPCDLEEVVDIETACFVHPWRREDFAKCLKRNNAVGMVAQYGRLIVGFLLFEVFKKRVQLLNLAVRPKYRRMGIATNLIKKIISAVSTGPQELLAGEVRESNLPVQLFFRKLNFMAVQILKEYYGDTCEDAYQFEYWVDKEATVSTA